MEFNEIIMETFTLGTAIGLKNASFYAESVTPPRGTEQGWLRLSLIHAFNKSGRHLEFSMNNVICGKIMHVAKMATGDESSVDVYFAVCSYKRIVFTLYQEEYFLYRMSLWVCYRNFKAFVQSLLDR